MGKGRLWGFGADNAYACQSVLMYHSTMDKEYAHRKLKQKQKHVFCVCSSVQYLPSMCEALNLTPTNICKINNKQNP